MELTPLAVRPWPFADGKATISKLRTLHADDELLRRYGFVIRSRPASGQNTWERNGHVYTEKEAAVIALNEEAADIAMSKQNELLQKHGKK